MLRPQNAYIRPMLSIESRPGIELCPICRTGVEGGGDCACGRLEADPRVRAAIAGGFFQPGPPPRAWW